MQEVWMTQFLKSNDAVDEELKALHTLHTHTHTHTKFKKIKPELLRIAASPSSIQLMVEESFINFF